MSREVCGICWCPYDDITGECACVPSTQPCPNCASREAQNTELDRKLAVMGAHSKLRTLTDEVIADLWYKNGTYHHHFARAIERWLKGEQ